MAHSCNSVQPEANTSVGVEREVCEAKYPVPFFWLCCVASKSNDVLLVGDVSAEGMVDVGVFDAAVLLGVIMELESVVSADGMYLGPCVDCEAESTDTREDSGDIFFGLSSSVPLAAALLS